MKYRGQYPKDWNVSLLDDITSRASGHTPNKNYPEYWNGGIKWVSLADSSKLDSGLIAHTDKEISRDGLKHSSAVLLPKGTVIISRDAGVGKSAVLAEEMAVSQHFIAWKCDGPNQLHNWYLYNWLQLNKPEFERQAIGSTIKTIGLPFFKKIKIAHPTYEEQRRIAEILSTWDQAIEATGKLIANSEAQKKALMQQLLTGKKRLPGFKGSWVQSKFDDLFEIVIGGTPSRRVQEYWASDAQDGLPWIAISDLKSKYISTTKESITELGANNSNVKWLYSGTVVLSFKLSIGKKAILKTGAYTNEAICGLVPRNAGLADMSFVFHMLEQMDLEESVDQAIKGKTLNKAKLRELVLNHPSFEEQRAIGSAIEAADRHLAVVRAQRDQLVREKSALMQQLLTGKRRVAINKEEAA